MYISYSKLTEKIFKKERGPRSFMTRLHLQSRGREIKEFKMWMKTAAETTQSAAEMADLPDILRGGREYHFRGMDYDLSDASEALIRAYRYLDAVGLDSAKGAAMTRWGARRIEKAYDKLKEKMKEVGAGIIDARTEESSAEQQ